MNLIEKQLKSEYYYKGKIVSLRIDDALLPNGQTAKREIIEHNGGVCVAALDSENNLLMVKQFRYPYGEVIYEIPAGKRNSLYEDPLLCGMRELKEETGATAEKYTFLGELYPTPGYCSEIIWIYAATNLSFGDAQPDEDEFLSVEKIPFQKALEMVLSNEIKDAKTQVAILKLNLLIKNGEI